MASGIPLQVMSLQVYVVNPPLSFPANLIIRVLVVVVMVSMLLFFYHRVYVVPYRLERSVMLTVSVKFHMF